MVCDYGIICEVSWVGQGPDFKFTGIDFIPITFIALLPVCTSARRIFLQP